MAKAAALRKRAEGSTRFKKPCQSTRCEVNSKTQVGLKLRGESRAPGLEFFSSDQAVARVEAANPDAGGTYRWSGSCRNGWAILATPDFGEEGR